MIHAFPVLILSSTFGGACTGSLRVSFASELAVAKPGGFFLKDTVLDLFEL